MTIKVVVDGKTVLGRPLAATSREIVMLRRDGRMLELAVSDLEKLEESGQPFTPYSSLQIQEHLQKLFGKAYEVTRTPHYVVVHPPGMKRIWADPFEELYRRFTHYFAVRGYTMQNPEFPLVVVVFDSRAEFGRVARRDGIADPDSLAGYYSTESNWIVTRNEPHADVNSSTLVHEALHQFAFNTGIHQRWAANPRWCAEGLATMFEARGVNDSGRYSLDNDRINSWCLDIVLDRLDKDPDAIRGLLENLIAGDRLFEKDTELAYAVSWGLTWFLCETRPADFDRYLQRIAARPGLMPYPAADRIADFREAFALDFSMLEAHLVRYVNDHGRQRATSGRP
jgi:hypothetical protein